MSQAETLHAGCVAWQDRGLLILGPSGSGKSALALALMAWGADLVSDDRTELAVEGDALIASAPPRLSGLIEARGIGILTAPPRASVRLTLAIDLGQTESERIPPLRSLPLMGLSLPLVLRPRHDHFHAAILCYLKGSRNA